jgi:uncharacterized membrane protein
MLHGGSERLGIILELYSEDAVSQYSWPFERIIIFLPAALIVTALAVFQVRKILTGIKLTSKNNVIPSMKSVRIIDLMTGMGFIGALSIWPAKIGVLYAFFLLLAIYAYNRLEQRFNILDQKSK